MPPETSTRPRRSTSGRSTRRRRRRKRHGRPPGRRAPGLESPRAMGQLESFNPATGELVGTVETIRPDQVQSVVDDVAEVQPFWAQLSLADRARYMRRDRRRAGRGHGVGRRPAHPRAGQADHRELCDGADADDRRPALVRRRGAADPRRREDPHPAGVPEDEEELLLLRAARRRRGDRAVELPVVDPLRRGRARAHGRQRSGAEAGEPDPAARRADPEGVRGWRAPRGPRADRPRRRRDRPGALRGIDFEDLLHWLGRGRAARSA